MMKNMSGGKGIHRSFRPNHSRTWIHSPAGLCWYHFHSPALRFGLCWYHVGLSALAHGIGKLAPKERLDTSIARQGYDPDTSVARQGYDPDTSIARQGYDPDTSIETSAPKVRPDISIAQRAMK